MVRLTSLAVQLALGGSYHDAVMADTPLGFWLLNELLTATGARDSSGNARDGTWTGSPVFGQPGALPHGGTATMLESASGDFASMGDVAAFEFTGACSVEFLFRFDVGVGGTNSYILSKVSGAQGWSVIRAATSGVINFNAYTAADVNVFSVSSSDDFVDDAWHHCVCTWTGTTAANGVKLYIDGALDAQSTAGAGTVATNAAPFQIGAASSTFFVDAQLAGVAVYGTELSAARVLAHYAATQWTDVTDDVDPKAGLSLTYGTTGTGPSDRLANIGTLEFTLDNSRRNSAGLRGYYSPHHANCRAGFTFDIPVRVQMVYASTTYTRFWGRLAVIDPEPGQFLDQKTPCLAYDYVFTLVDTDIRAVDAQASKTEVELLSAVFEALPHTAQPMAIDFDTAVDTYPYAFHDLAGGRKAATVLDKVLRSAWGDGFVHGDGTFRYRNRQTNASASIALTLTDQHLLQLTSPNSRSDVFNLIRVTVHPKDVDAAATTVLYSHPSAGDLLVSAAGGMRELWCEYRNPNDDYATTIGGLDMVTPVSATDFVANSAADGSGTNLTASVTVTAEFFASVAKLTLTNNHATLAAYFTTLQIRGKGVYDLRPVTLEARGEQSTRPLPIDLVYQASAAIGQDIADFILNERESVMQPVERVQFRAQQSNTLMLGALVTEPGDVVSVSEAQTGIVEAQVLVRSIALTVGPLRSLTSSFGVFPVTVGEGWLLGETGRSELDETTILGAG